MRTTIIGGRVGVHFISAIALLGVGCGGSGAGQDDAVTPTVSAAAEPDAAPRDASEAWLDVVSERIEVGQYRFLQDGADFRARTVAERLVTRFDSEGAHVATGERDDAQTSEVTLRLSSWGRAGGEQEAGKAAPTLGGCTDTARVDAEGKCLERLEFVRGDLLEWWENSSRGLQQGFTLARKPNGAGRVRLLIDVTGATVLATGDGSLALERPDGSTVSYDELAVFDADGNWVASQLEIVDGRIAIGFDDAAARYPITVDPIVTTTWETYSTIDTSAPSSYGQTAAGLGDVNGDGFDDFAVGAPAEGASKGSVYVFHGSATGPAMTAAKTFTGSGASLFGYALSGAGDVNGDGFGDMIVGEPMAPNGIGTGSASLFLGSASGFNTAPTVIPAQRPGSRFGQSVACAGDIDGDHYADVIIGAPLATYVVAGEGAVHVYRGGAGAFNVVPVVNIAGGVANAAFGFSVAGVGSFDGDGLSDVVVGAPFQNQMGAVKFFKGKTSAPYLELGWTDVGTQLGESFGESVAPTGDANGDLRADFVVGAPTFDYGTSTNAGRLFVYSGNVLSTKDFREERKLANVLFYGRNMRGAGDVNGDGKGDFGRGGTGVGTGISFGEGPHPVEYGATVNNAYVFAGVGDVDSDGFADAVYGKPVQSVTGYAALYRGKGAYPRIAFDPDLVGGSAAEMFGATVIDAGDVNGDGFSDLAVSSYLFDDAQTGAGKVTLYFGSSAGPRAPVTVGTGGQTDAHFGWSLAAGDFNGDGFSDLAVGAADYDNVQSDEGRVYVYPGSATGIGTALQPPIEINQVGARLGYALAAGDINADGFADLAASASVYDGGQTDEGGVFIYRGGPGGLPTAVPAALEVNSASAWFGSALAIGDVNGDGCGDLVVGAKMFTNGHSKEGNAYVYHCSGNQLALQTGWNPQPNQADARFGGALSLDADVNGDGRADLIVGAAKFDNGNTNEGRVWLYPGSATGLGSATGSAEGNLDAAQLGLAVSGGDLDGDGVGEVAASAPFASLSQAIRYYTVDSSLQLVEKPGLTDISGPFAATFTMTADFNGDGMSDTVAQREPPEGSRLRFWRHELNGIVPRLYRAGSTTVRIAPGGKANSTGVDIKVLLQSPYGKGPRFKVVAEVKQIGTAFNGQGLVKSSAWQSGTEATLTTVRNLVANKAYHYRVRLDFEQVLGYGATHSRWYYGGLRGQGNGVHFRTP